MKILYGIEPDICIGNTKLLTDYNQDIVLPKYFYSQIIYLSRGNFAAATEAANRIITALFHIRNSDLLMFKNDRGGTVYFINEATNYIDFEEHYKSIDTRNPLDRYLLRLLELSSSLEVKIVFLATSAEVTKKCRTLNFDITSLEDFHSSNESWLEPQMLINTQSDIDNMYESENLDPYIIQWRDIKSTPKLGNIEWRNIR